VSEWDKNYPRDIGSPGDDPAAPYYAAHQAATKVEKVLCKVLGLDWKMYDAALGAAAEKNV
jgi:hypothetical protein